MPQARRVRRPVSCRPARACRSAARVARRGAWRGPALRRWDGRSVVVLIALALGGAARRLPAQAAASVLATLPGSTRAAALGGAGAALTGDAGGIFANPAAIATVHRVALEAWYARAPDRTAWDGAALALRVGRFDWGAGVETRSDASVPPADFLGVSSLVFRAGLIALGGSAKYARQTIGGATSTGWAGDAGLAIAVFDIMALGVSVQNLGSSVGTGARLPRRTRAGFTMNYVDPQGTLRLLTTLEGQWPDSGGALVVVGAEGGVVGRGIGLIARTGYTSRAELSGASRFTLGGAVELGRFHLDYAYRAIAAPGADTHRVGVRWIL